MNDLVGIVLAAGKGSRMGGTKQLLPWPPGKSDVEQIPLIAAAFDAVTPLCGEMIVVVGHEAPAVIEALGDRDFTAVESSSEADMYESVRRGLVAAGEIDGGQRGVLLHCGDHPEVAGDTLTALRDTARAAPERAIIPVYRERGGHPVLIASRLRPALIAYSGQGGLRQYWIDHPEACQRIAVDDPGVVLGINRPEDYQDT